MHENQVEVVEATVRGLIGEQFPRWNELAVRRIATSGTVNTIFRVGDGLTARFPLRLEDAGVVRSGLIAEAAAMRELAQASKVPTPEPLAIGEPGHGYPMPWSVQTWLPGETAEVDDPSGSTTFASELSDLIASLRVADTRGRRFEGAGRGGHLPHHDAWMETCFVESENIVDVPRLRTMWADFRTIPVVDSDVMCHGDLTPANVLVREGHLVGVLDGGGFAAADPALDLVGAWHLLDDAQREVLRESLGCSDIQWRRGMAWAFQQSMGLVWYYAASNPSMSRWGSRTLDRLISCYSS